MVATVCAVEGGCCPAHQHGGGLDIEFEVRKDDSHERLVDERVAKRLALARVPQRLGDGLAHSGGRPGNTVEAGGGDHVDNRRDAPPFLTNHFTPCLVELDFCGGVRTVAELVFEALDIERVARAVG